jgi:hypothetical protein
MKRLAIAAAILALTSLVIPVAAAAKDAPSGPATPPKPPQAVSAAPAAPAAKPVAPSAPAAPAAPTAPTAPAAKPPASFEQMKGLLGEWEGNYEGKVGHVSFKLVSGGTAIMETMDPSEGEDMVTLYYPDGDRLMLTHYCASNNQPRMRTEAASSDPKTLVFNYVDATNLAASKGGVMSGLTISFVDADHHTETWAWMDKIGGTPSMTTFAYARKK